MNGFLMDHGKIIDAPSLVDFNFVAATCRRSVTRLLAIILSLRYVARTHTSLNSFDRSQRQNSVAETMICTCHTRRFVGATCRGDVSQRFVASRVSVDCEQSLFLSSVSHARERASSGEATRREKRGRQPEKKRESLSGSLFCAFPVSRLQSRTCAFSRVLFDGLRKKKRLLVV